MILRYVQDLALAVIKQVCQEYVSGTSAMAREAKKFFLSQDFDFWAELANSNLSGEVMLKRLEPLRERNKANRPHTFIYA